MGSNTESIETRWRAILEDRHGAGTVEQLIAQLRQPCVTFAEIARRYDVTRERVRQWHLRILPGAPRGHERQRLCAASQQRRRLLEEPLFRAFYRHVRPHVPAGRIELIKGSEGYRTRAVRIDRRVVALRRATESAGADSLFSLARYRGPGEFVYYRLTADDYLFLPVSAIPATGATFSDRQESPYRAFKNTFAALTVDADPGPVQAPGRDANCY